MVAGRKSEPVAKAVLFLAAFGGIVFLGALIQHRWETRGEWFPMDVGDRWTYRDANTGDRIVFEVLRQDKRGAFVVERRIGLNRETFTVSVTADSVFLLEASGDAFVPPFEEFRLPHARGSEWTYEGSLGGRPVSVTLKRTPGDPRQFHVEEASSISGLTLYTVERGKGVVQLSGKRSDLHGSGYRGFVWTLEKFERGGS